MTLAEGLLRDVRSGCQRCVSAISARTESELVTHCQQAQDTLAVIEGGVNSALASGPTGPVDVRNLAPLSRSLDVFRQTRLPFFDYYSVDARYMTRLTARLADEAALPVSRPIVGLFSNSGFWTNPEHHTLCMPAGEQGMVLSLPDVVHELGHNFLHEVGGSLTTEIVADVVAQYVQGLESGKAKGSANKFATDDERRQFAADLYRQYQIWHVEFVADVAAAYVCGPSYGRQNIRLTAQNGALENPWFPSEPARVPDELTHPADSARTYVIVAALRATGHPKDATEVETIWAGLTGSPQPTRYPLTYPTDVLDGICDRTIKWCQANAVIPFSQAQSGNIVVDVDEAWQLQWTDPAAFAAQEAQLVMNLRSKV